MENNLHMQGAQETPRKINFKRSSPRHITIKTLKAKDKNFESSKRNDTLKHPENQHVRFNNSLIRLTWFSNRNHVEEGRQWDKTKY